MDLVTYINQIGKTFWSETMDFDTWLEHGMYEQELTKVPPILDPAAFTVSMRMRNCELNENVGFP